MLSDWKPIETAPKDGTRMFFFVSYFIVVGSYQAGAWEVSWDASKLREPPTHWMPLPLSPRGESC